MDKADLKGLERFKPQKYPAKESNWASLGRFKELNNSPTQENVGPGAYREINKWNKRTYNLKFLNNQSQASAPSMPQLLNDSTTKPTLDSSKLILNQ